MKICKIFSVFLFLLMVTLYTACDVEQHAPQNVILKEKQWIKLRNLCEDCTENDDCCCAVWLEEEQPDADLFICNVVGAGFSCAGSAVGNCSSFSGVGAIFELDETTNPRDSFCISENVPFYIKNTSTTSSTVINITCQGHLTHPQTTEVELDPEETLYFETDGDCLISGCQ